MGKGGRGAKDRPIDEFRLKAALARRELDIESASLALGYSKYGLKQYASRGYLKEYHVLMLEHILDVEYDEYKPAEKGEKETTSQGFVLDKNELYQVIYTAVYHAFKEVLTEDADRKIDKENSNGR